MTNDFVHNEFVRGLVLVFLLFNIRYVVVHVLFGTTSLDLPMCFMMGYSPMIILSVTVILIDLTKPGWLVSLASD